MNIGNVLFSPNGRIGQQDYWIGVLIIIGGNIIANFIPILGFIISLGLIWVGVAVYGKRLHDSGKTAWIHALPWALSIVLSIVGVVMIVASAISAGIISESADLSVDQIVALVSAGGVGLLLLGLSSLVWVIYTIWVGVMAGDAGDNRFGAAPGADAATAANVAAASSAAGAPPASETAAPPAPAAEAEPAPEPAPPAAETPEPDGDQPEKS